MPMVAHAHNTVWDSLSAFPPILVRLAARRSVAGKNVASVSHQEIAIASGIPLDRVIEISHMTSWDSVSLGELKRFCEACNFDPTKSRDRERQREYIRLCQKKHPDRPPQYLYRSPLWATQFLPLINHLKTMMSSQEFRPSPSQNVKSAA